MNPITETYTLVAAAATGIALSQAGTANTPLTINGTLAAGGIATLDSGGAARRAIITSAGNDSAITFAITGRDRYGNLLTDTVAGTNAGTAVSNLDFVTVTKVVPSANTAANVTAGTNTTGSAPWHFPSRELTPFSIMLAANIPVGTQATVEHTYDDPNLYAYTGYPYGSVNPNSAKPPVIFQNAGIKVATGQVEGSYDRPIFALRLTINSGTGTAQWWAEQAGIAGN